MSMVISRPGLTFFCKYFYQKLIRGIDIFCIFALDSICQKGKLFSNRKTESCPKRKTFDEMRAIEFARLAERRETDQWSTLAMFKIREVGLKEPQ